MHAVTKKRTRVGSKTQTRGRAVAAATATYDSSTAADQAAAADSFDQSNPSPWADHAKAVADAASAQAVSQAAAQQTASDTAADDGKVSEIAANDAEAALADNQSQAWHDQVLAMAQGENAFSLASAGSAAQLAAADAYFAAVGGAGVGAGSPDPATTGVPAPLSGPGGDTPITLTGDYGNSHPIGSYWVGDTADSIDAVVSNMFRRGPDPEAAIGPQGSWAYTWFGAGEGMPYGLIAASVQPGLNMMSPDLQSAQPNVATPNVFGPQILAQSGASGGAQAPPEGGASASAGAPTDTGNPAHSVPLSGNGEQTNTVRDGQLLAMADLGDEAEALNQIYRGLLAMAGKDPEGARAVLDEQKFFNTFGHTPDSRAKWAQLQAVAKGRLDAASAETVAAGRKATETDRALNAQNQLKPLATDPPITMAEATEAHERGLLANAAYGGDAPAGWREVAVIDDQTMQVAGLATPPGPKGFRAVLYEQLDAEGEPTGKYVLAFAGTEVLADNGADLAEDASQALVGDSAQYQYAIEITRDIVKRFGKENVSLTGHS